MLPKPNFIAENWTAYLKKKKIELTLKASAHFLVFFFFLNNMCFSFLSLKD